MLEKVFMMLLAASLIGIEKQQHYLGKSLLPFIHDPPCGFDKIEERGIIEALCIKGT
jgi:hypothetical protein